MSTGVERSKGQSNTVSNGPNKQENIKESEFEYVQGQQSQGGYGNTQMSNPYSISSYYTYPFFNQGDGAWSNGDPMSFLGYGQQMGSEYIATGNGMFNNGFGYSQPGLGWELPGPVDYNRQWNATNNQGSRKIDRVYNDVYYASNMAPMEGYTNGDIEKDRTKTVDQGLRNMSLSDRQTQNDEFSNSDSNQRSSSQSHCNMNSLQAPKKMSWASVASQPARPQNHLRSKAIPPAPVLPGRSRHVLDIGTWDNKNNSGNKGTGSGSSQPRQQSNWTSSRGRSSNVNNTPPSIGGYGPVQNDSSAVSDSPGNASHENNSVSVPLAHPVLDKLITANQYNPKEFNVSPRGARYFIIKSYSEDDIHRSIKYSIWCSTEHGNKRLDAAYREREGKGPIYLLFSVNGSGHFCGMGQMMSALDYTTTSSVWAQAKWKGRFEVKWIYVKDVPNSQLRHIRLENNENKPVTNSRDTQEVPPEKGKQVLKIIHSYRHTTSIFDDFGHYEKRQEEDLEPSESSSNRDRGNERLDRSEREHNRKKSN